MSKRLVIGFVCVMMLALAAVAQAQDGVDADYNRAMELLDKSPQAPQAAIPLLRASAQKGNLDAAYNLGVALYTGIKTKENQAEAMTWFKKAADAGNVKATFNLATAYEESGAAVAPKALMELYTQAAEGGITQAMHRLGALKVEHDKDLVAGMTWLILADAYEDEDVKPDLAKAQDLATKTQRQQATDAATRLRATLEGNPEFLNNMSL